MKTTLRRFFSWDSRATDAPRQPYNVRLDRGAYSTNYAASRMQSIVK